MVLVKNIRNKGNTFSLCIHIAINIIEHQHKHKRRICESQHEWEIKNASQGFQITVNVLVENGLYGLCLEYLNIYSHDKKIYSERQQQTKKASGKPQKEMLTFSNIIFHHYFVCFRFALTAFVYSCKKI